jgi:hypothetical protein
MVLSNALGVVIMMADPPTGATSTDIATDVPTTPVEAGLEAELEAELAADLAAEPQPQLAVEPEPVPEPEPEGAPPRTKWRGAPYFTFGFAPMATMNINAGFHPGIRYDMETGLAWKRGRVRAYFGPDFHLMQYLGRKKVGFGVDAMATFTLRHVYARVGAGASMGMPAGTNVKDTHPMIGGILGAGLVGRLDKVEGRFGVDYDVRVDTTGRVAQTVLLTMRLTFGP